MRRTEVLKASPPMFRSRVLDALTRVHPAVPVAVFSPAIAWLAWLAGPRSGVGPTALLAVLGYFTWTLTEYWLHRVVFHFEPRHPVGRRLHWMLHGVHHDHPNDRLRLVMPPSVSVPLGLLFGALFWLVLGPVAAPAFMAGFTSGYLIYDMVHFHVHHHRPRTRLGRKLRELHMRHHFQDHDTAFGVSAPWWDVLFGTSPGRPRRSDAGSSR